MVRSVLLQSDWLTNGCACLLADLPLLRPDERHFQVSSYALPSCSGIYTIRIILSISIFVRHVQKLSKRPSKKEEKWACEPLVHHEQFITIISPSRSPPCPFIHTSVIRIVWTDDAVRSGPRVSLGGRSRRFALRQRCTLAEGPIRRYATT